MKRNISPPVMRQHLERPHVSFARESPLKRNMDNPVALLSGTESLIIDSPFKLATTELDDYEGDDKSCETIEPTKVVNRNQVRQNKKKSIIICKKP